MAKIKNRNLQGLALLFESLTGVINDMLGKERALPVYKIHNYAQKQLDLAGSSDYEQGGYILDPYMDPNGTFVVAAKNDGKMYKAAVTVSENNDIEIGPYEEVVMDFKPVVGRSITVKRQKDGSLRWFAIPACTAVVNRVGEIDSRDLFDSFLEYIERSGNYPQLDFFHFEDQAILGVADYVWRDGYSYCATGLFNDSDLAQRAAVALEEDPDFWGLSIGYLPTSEPEVLRNSDGIDIPVFNAGINGFISLLPEDTAASILTSISTTTSEGVDRMKKEARSAFKALGLTDKEIDAFDATLDGVERTTEKMVRRTTDKDKTKVTKPGKPGTKNAKELTEEARAKTRTAATPENVKAILADPEFKTVLRDTLAEMRDESAAAAPGNGDKDESTEESDDESTEESDESTEETDTEETETTEEASETNELLRSIAGKLDEFNDRLEAVEVTQIERAEIGNLLQDLPSKVSKREIVRPRTRTKATVLPNEIENRADGVKMEDLAAKTLRKMERN